MTGVVTGVVCFCVLLLTGRQTVSFLRDFVSLSCFFFLSLSFSFLFFKFKLLYELRLVPKVCIHVFSKSSAVIISV